MTDTLYARRPDTVAANLGEELAVLDLPSGSYLGFNATAAHVWRLLSRPRSLDALCDGLTAEFEIDADRCRREVSALLERLVAANLAIIVDG
ncbi:MAG: PqqD family protein [Caulobacter sp.]|nr:PqqD family protein [Caulobacter sp.]